MRIATGLASIVIAFFPQIVHAQLDCGFPSAGADQWPVAAPESVGLDSASLCPLVKWLKESEPSNVHAVLVARHGALVFEHYFSGSDEILGRPIGEVAFGPETLHDERSVSKSIVALVVGIAIDRGLIESIDAPSCHFCQSMQICGRRRRIG